MEEIAGGRLPESYSPINKNLKASPYSVLRQSDEQEVQATMEQMLQQAAAAHHGGNRTTRTELLRQLALKQKLAKNPSLGHKVKITRGTADHLALDPLINDPSRSVDCSQFKTIDSAVGKPMRARMRNQRGEYQSIDFGQRESKDIETSGHIVDLTVRNDQVNTGAGSQEELAAQNHLRSSSTANPMMGSADGLEGVPDSHRSGMVGAATSRTLANASEIHMAESRLRIIERISKYREEKIKKEFLKLEHELQEENHNMRRAQIKELK